jgi:hypothetical protein
MIPIPSILSAPTALGLKVFTAKVERTNEPLLEDRIMSPAVAADVQGVLVATGGPDAPVSLQYMIAKPKPPEPTTMLKAFLEW